MRVTLRRNAWHAKLQEWIFGDVTHRKNLCPYFWLTVFCILVSPFILAFRGLLLLMKLIGRCLDLVLDPLISAIEGFQSQRKDRALTNETVELGLEGAYRIWKMLTGYNSTEFYERITHPLFRTSLRQRYEALLQRFQDLNPSWRDLFTQHEAELEERMKRWKELQLQREREREQRQRDRERLMNSIALWTKWFVTGVLWALLISLGSILAYIAGYLLYQFYLNFWSIDWLGIFKTLGYCVAAAIALASIFAGGRWVLEHANKEHEPAPPKEPGLVKLYFKAAKENYCPGVDWVD